MITNRKKKKIRICLIGCGRISNIHFESIMGLSNDFELVAVCDKDKKKLKKIPNSFKLKKYTDIKTMVNENNPDLVTLTTPNGLHYTQSILLAKMGINVLTEKPMSLNVFQAKKMLHIFSKKNLQLFVVMQMRFSSNLLELKKIIKSKELGNIFSINMNLFWARPQKYYNSNMWRGTKNLDGGTFLNQAIHYIDLLLWIFGDIDSIFGHIDTLSRKIEFEDSGAVIIKFKNKAIATINLSMLSNKKNYETSLTIIGSKGNLKLMGKDLSKIEYVGAKRKLTSKIKQKKQLKIKSNHKELYKNIILSLRGKPNKSINGKVAIDSIKIVEAIYIASKKKRFLKI